MSESGQKLKIIVDKIYKEHPDFTLPLVKLITREYGKEFKISNPSEIQSLSEENAKMILGELLKNTPIEIQIAIAECL